MKTNTITNSKVPSLSLRKSKKTLWYSAKSKRLLYNELKKKEAAGQPISLRMLAGKVTHGY